jgi:Raf kinase inhibitor-like YbhB/YbcL family protein
MRARVPLAWGIAVTWLATGCGGDAPAAGSTPSSSASASGAAAPARELPGTDAGPITVTSSAFGEGQTVPEKYTCDGEGVSPPLAWRGVPTSAAALALVVDDPDAPRGTYTHWVVLDVAPDVVVADEGRPPTGGVQADNSGGDAGYAGPCPPSGTHHYRFTVHALDAETGLGQGADLSEALAAVEKHTVATGRLTAVYAR